MQRWAGRQTEREWTPRLFVGSAIGAIVFTVIGEYFDSSLARRAGAICAALFCLMIIVGICWLLFGAIYDGMRNRIEADVREQLRQERKSKKIEKRYRAKR